MHCSVTNPELHNKPWHSSAHSTVGRLLYGCLFKLSRMLPRRDFHAWANLRTPNQILLCGQLLVACQETFCAVYLNNQTNQAWPPSLSMEDPYMPVLCPPVCLCHSVLKHCNPIDRRDEECNTSHKGGWGGLRTSASFWIVFSAKLSQFLV